MQHGSILKPTCRFSAALLYLTLGRSAHSGLISSSRDKVISAFGSTLERDNLLCTWQRPTLIHLLSICTRPPLRPINAGNWAHSVPVKTHLTSNHNLVPHLMQQELRSFSLFHNHYWSCSPESQKTNFFSSLSLLKKTVVITEIIAPHKFYTHIFD